MHSKSDEQDNSVLYCQKLRSDDWLLSLHLSERDLCYGPYTAEAATSEVASQLAWKMRRSGLGRPAILTKDMLPVAQDLELVSLAQAKTVATACGQVSVRVDCQDTTLLVSGDLPVLRNAMNQLPLAGSVILASFPDTRTVMTVIEFAEGIGLRASDEHDVLRAVTAIAAALGYALRTEDTLNAEWAQEYIDGAADAVVKAGLG